MRTTKDTATLGLRQVRGERPSAVIIGLDCLPGIQTARILAKNGVPVIGIARKGRKQPGTLAPADRRMQADQSVRSKRQPVCPSFHGQIIKSLAGDTVQIF